MKQTSIQTTADRAMDLLRRLVEWNDQGDCRGLSEFVEEARRLLATDGVLGKDHETFSRQVLMPESKAKD